jgi:hypothetical protein
MHKQIEQALEKLASMSGARKEKARAILSKYAEGQMSLDEAYYELLEEELVPMPSRCGMYAKVEGDEEDLKRRIREKLSLA